MYLLYVPVVCTNCVGAEETAEKVETAEMVETAEKVESTKIAFSQSH